MSEQDQQICGGFGALQERARELACLHLIEELLKNPDTPLDDVLRGVVCAIPSGWCDPQACQARIELENQTFHSAGFRDSYRVHSADIRLQSKRVGAIEICCARETPCADGDPLLGAKRKLVDAVAGRVAGFLSVQYLLRLSMMNRLPDDPDVVLGHPGPAEETEPPPSLEVEYPGLCMTCVHSSTCAFPRRKGQAVLSCEEFDEHGEGPAEGADLTPPVVEEGRASAAPMKGESPEYKGLCSSCENRETCAFPKPPGGVWHCEEFS